MMLLVMISTGCKVQYKRDCNTNLNKEFEKEPEREWRILERENERNRTAKAAEA